ncbi:MAG: tetratricopeptide repeat protein [Verrucomicrobiota bacterium]
MSEPDYEVYKDDGDMALAIGELHEAVDCYRRAVNANPDYFDGWHALSMALIKTDQFEEAVEAAKLATQVDPNNQFGWTTLSLAYVRLDKIAEAEAAGAKAKVISWGGKVKLDSDGVDK